MADRIGKVGSYIRYNSNVVGEIKYSDDNRQIGEGLCRLIK